MQRALELAAKGIGHVAPNPLVGCVIVHNEQIIGEGWHRKFGAAHAEINAIESVEDKSLLAHSTLYVTLEPCSHFGKTPPCANRIVEEKIPKVVIASFDPNPLVSGKGAALLRQSGIEVTEGFMKQEADFMNRRFICFHNKKRPYVIAKWAQSADGFMDIDRIKGQTGSFAISGPHSAIYNHRWRSEEQAILVGKQTVLTDNPLLTVRHWNGANPIRVVIDPNLEIPRQAAVFDQSVRTLVFNRLETRTLFNVERIQLDFSREIIPDILQYLHYEGIQSLIVEGGAYTLGRFFNSGQVDEIRKIIATDKYLNTGLKAPLVNSTLAEIILPQGMDRIEISYL